MVLRNEARLTERETEREQLEAHERSECETGETTASEHTYASDCSFPLSLLSLSPYTVSM